MDAGRVVEDRQPASFFDQPKTDRARTFLRRVHARESAVGV
jgi:ABC-type polar amino acid transport system ATPase subunit